MKKNNIAIILARGGSKGIKNKNVYKLNKMPLIYWSIKSCLKANMISSVWVSSDSNKILKISKKYGANVIKRPKKISGDYSTSEVAWYHALAYIKNKIKNIDAVVGIQPTSPIRPPKLLNDGLKKFYNEKLDSLILADCLDQYAQTGAEYTKVLKKIIEQNSLKDFDDVKLLPTSRKLKKLI